MIDLMQGDCLELMKNIPDKSIDMILCDLPYGTSSCQWDIVIPFDELWESYKRIIKPCGVICLFGNEPFSTYMRMSNIKNFKYDWIWDKNSTNGFLNAKKRPLKRYETISVFSYGTPVYFPQMQTKGKPRLKGGYNKRIGNGDMVYGRFNDAKSVNNEYYPTNILNFSNAVHKEKLHPTQKPTNLLEYLIKTYTKEGETVLDNCAGSMSTAIACINTNRNGIMIEKDEHYFAIGQQRINKYLEEHK